MKDSENKRVSFLVEDDDQKNGTDAPKQQAVPKCRRFRF